MKKARFGLVVTLIGIGFILAVVKAFNIQIVKGNYYKSLYMNQITKNVVIKGYRGLIYDAKGRALAVNFPVYTFFVDPWFYIKLDDFYKDSIKYQLKKEKFFKDVYKITGLTQNHILKIIDSHPSSRFIRLKVLNLTEYKKLSSNPNFLKSFGLIKRYKRFYPDGSSSAHVIGFCFENGKGAEGLENYYNRYLAAPKIKEKVMLDAYNNPQSIILPHGTNIQISLNEDIQDFVHKALFQTIKKYKAEKGIVIVMNPYTGAVIAMDSYPFYNNNKYWEYTYKDIKNRAVSDVFEPGSVFKLLTMSAALDSGIFKGNEIIYCNNGSWRIGNKIIHDVERFHYLSFKNVFVYSSNIGSAKIALKLGKKIFYKYLYKFGLGQKTGIDTISESPGIVKDFFNVGKVDLANMAFGQGIGVTEIQLADMYSTIANGGYKVRPHFILKMMNNGKITYTYKIYKTRILKPSTVQKVKNILRDVVVYGTGVKAQLPDYKVAGKTGTAQIAKNGKYINEYVASFAGFAPFEHPRFVVVVSIFNPHGSIYGGDVAAPLFAKIMEFTLHYYGVKPDK